MTIIGEETMRECPFCGVIPQAASNSQTVYHPQVNCSLNGWHFNLDKWNTRSPEAVTVMREALDAISSQAICYGMRADETELRDWLKFISETADAALLKVTR